MKETVFTFYVVLQSETEAACLALYDNPSVPAFAKILSDPTRWGSASLCMANAIQDRKKVHTPLIPIFVANS